MSAKIFYYDIGDYLSREEKLNIIKGFKSFANPDMPLISISPNAEGDWISMRNAGFEKLIPIAPEKKFDTSSASIFIVYSRGVGTSRDAWVYNFSLKNLKKNIKHTIEHYNEQRELINKGKQKEPNRDSTKGNWTNSWLIRLSRNKIIVENKHEYRRALYRPYSQMNQYFETDLIHEKGLWDRFFPQKNSQNLVICVQHDAGERMSPLIANTIVDLELVHHAQCFPLYYYEENNREQGMLHDEVEGDYIRRDGVSDFIVHKARAQYGVRVSKEDIFFYVYGFLHSPSYRTIYASDLKKMLPRLPLVDSAEDFWAFSKKGRALAELHIKYEAQPSYSGLLINGQKLSDPLLNSLTSYTVEKMRFPKKDQKDTIIYNSQITISGIPARAYDYIVNGKSAIEWIMERYQITQHKESLITNDPNDWALEHDQPRYILDLLLSIITVSVETVTLVAKLPQWQPEVTQASEPKADTTEVIINSEEYSAEGDLAAEGKE